MGTQKQTSLGLSVPMFQGSTSLGLGVPMFQGSRKYEALAFQGLGLRRSMNHWHFKV